jgi:xanthine dehydrogenase/oxidase
LQTSVSQYCLSIFFFCILEGQRHAFLAQYKVGFTSDGVVKAIDMHLFAGVGNSWDLSQAIIDRALLHR